MADDYLKLFNESQLKAVTAEPCNLLILAGAGTGKTTTVVGRISYLLRELKVKPWEILAVTFTNKAASELKERVAKACSDIEKFEYLWAGTFHSICARFLRSYSFAAGLKPNFTIIDADDQKRIVKRILIEMDFPFKSVDESSDKIVKAVCEEISSAKEKGHRAKDYSGDTLSSTLKKNFQPDDLVELYYNYEEYCQRSSLVDFSELLLRTYETFLNNRQLLELQHKRFLHILVDEFQDTNSIQYRLIKLLAGNKAFVTAVGDDDQSIYSWRGADFKNLSRFVDDFDQAKLISLEDNYRSGRQILDVANALLQSSNERLVAKNLRAARGEGNPVVIKGFNNSFQEADFVAREIKRLHVKENISYSDMVILYRFNSLSLKFEQSLTGADIRYNIWGGLRFYDREEVKNVMAYLRLAVNQDDNAALTRVINVPSRKIGDAKLDFLQQSAAEQNCSLFTALERGIGALLEDPKNKALKTNITPMIPFYELILKFKDAVEGLPLNEALETIINDSGLREYYEEKDLKEQQKVSEGEGRIGNIEELLRHAAEQMNEWRKNPILDEDGNVFSDAVLFVSNASLLASSEMKENGDVTCSSFVNLSTIHSAKGLEFKVVFVVGWEQGCLPSYRAARDEIGEERRLAYVAITRAKDLLYLTYCTFPRLRYIRGGARSAFLEEIIANTEGTPLEGSIKIDISSCSSIYDTSAFLDSSY